MWLEDHILRLAKREGKCLCGHIWWPVCQAWTKKRSVLSSSASRIRFGKKPIRRFCMAVLPVFRASSEDYSLEPHLNQKHATCAKTNLGFEIMPTFFSSPNSEILGAACYAQSPQFNLRYFQKIRRPTSNRHVFPHHTFRRPTGSVISLRDLRPVSVIVSRTLSSQNCLRPHSRPAILRYSPQRVLQRKSKRLGPLQQ